MKLTQRHTQTPDQTKTITIALHVLVRVVRYGMNLCHYERTLQHSQKHPTKCSKNEVKNVILKISVRCFRILKHMT